MAQDKINEGVRRRKKYLEIEYADCFREQWMKKSSRFAIA
jgi:hypothetical protein